MTLISKEKYKEEINNTLRKLRALPALKCLLIVSSFFIAPIVSAKPAPIKITIAPNQPGLITLAIQKAIDSCAANGGGVVFFPSGNFTTGGIQ